MQKHIIATQCIVKEGIIALPSNKRLSSRERHALRLPGGLVARGGSFSHFLLCHAIPNYRSLMSETPGSVLGTNYAQISGRGHMRLIV